MENRLENVIGCTMHVNAGRNYQDVMSSIAPILGWIDPAYRFVKVCDLEESFYKGDQCKGKTLSSRGNSLSAQALSLILLLHENSKYFNSRLCTQYFEESPWKHHFTIELNRERRPAILAKQSFYQFSKDFPMLSVCNVHHGCECIRFQLLVENYSRMKSFYQEVFGQELILVRKDFCYCVIHQEPGFQLHFSLKFLPELTPYPTRKAILIFRVRRLTNEMFCKLKRLSFFESSYKQGNRIFIPDPDGNMVLFETLYD